MNRMEDSNNINSTGTSDFLDDDIDVYEYEEAYPDQGRYRDDDPPPPPPMELVPMTPDRVARKQRSLARRGGANHYALMKSAVLASMETMESDDDTTVRSRRNSMVTLQDCCSCDTPTSPRKRFRRHHVRLTNESEDDAIARASSLMGTLNVVDGNAPVRRVSRRTSYDSRVSEVSDLDLEDI